MISKQVLLGSALVLGGGVTFFALAKNDKPVQEPVVKTGQAPQIAKPTVQPLTADVATEERLLAQKQKEREAHTRQMQKQTEQLLAEQQKARLNALNKANAENGSESVLPADKAAKSELIALPTVQTRPEAVEAARQAEEAKRLAEEAKKAELAKKAAEASLPKKPEESKKSATNTNEADKKKADEAKRLEEKRAEERRQAAKKAEEAKRAEVKNAQNKKSDTNARDSKAGKSGQYQVQAGETWLGIANRHGVSVAALTQANGMSTGDIIREGQTLKIPSGSQASRTKDNKAAWAKNQTKQEQNAKKAEAKKTETKKAESKKVETKKGEEKKSDKKSDDKKQNIKSDVRANKSGKDQNPHLAGRYTVQVAITPDRAKVDKLVKQYRAAGYTVNTSNTSRGTRVLIGGAKSADAAKALRSKVANDSRVNSDGAFIHKVE
ncbi:SPOR and LysM peptidoglycan-binding domain-containing protein [Moraxella nasicaprae]|uniref:SPOR domain-containing protein n=1 Tax=Moraxella nasicaprae TaxID=2904122 RepID=A0ABY6F547_9GAMM|nr:LysM peptidoglycan-binding domain-containing protein [Moraxella nasicaprae]UXZ05216.1 SPOR domain-containing protein [Moraxella nasicaprae]